MAQQQNEAILGMDHIDCHIALNRQLHYLLTRFLPDGGLDSSQIMQIFALSEHLALLVHTDVKTLGFFERILDHVHVEIGRLAKARMDPFQRMAIARDHLSLSLMEEPKAELDHGGEGTGFITPLQGDETQLAPLDGLNGMIGAQLFTLGFLLGLFSIILGFLIDAILWIQFALHEHVRPDKSRLQRSVIFFGSVRVIFDLFVKPFLRLAGQCIAIEQIGIGSGLASAVLRAIVG